MPINIDRIAADIRAIAACTHTPGNGATRPTFSIEWARARDYVIAEGKKIDCDVRIDAAGNVFMKPARLRAADSRLRTADAPPIRTWLCGSHIDTVPHGGDYDGVAGIVVALELIRSAHEDGVLLPLELVIFAEEEGPTFGLGMLGSRALVGELTAVQLGQLKNKEGQTYLEAGVPYGVKPDEIADSRLRLEQHHGLIELHIEQGPGMWRRDQCIAVVSAIAGRQQFQVEVHGEANHAGATSMEDRRDALVVASRIIVALERLANELGDSAVVTVGRLDVQPNAINVIPNLVRFTIDFRAAGDETLRRGGMAIRELIDDSCGGDFTFSIRETESIPARPMARTLVEASQHLGITTRTVSGALHDSAVLAPHLPTVMLFVPSRDGISHNPAEFSRVEDIAQGAKVIERLVRRPSMDLINATFDRDAFVALAGRFYEHSSWVAERAFAAKPFTSIADLSAKMSDVVRRSSTDEQLELIRAHPDLVGRMATERPSPQPSPASGRGSQTALTLESQGEQKAAGLTQLSPAEIEQFEQFNAAYKQRFGFPFVICARQNKKDAILAAFPVRLQNTVEQEVAAALAEIDKIALLRMTDAIWE